MTGAWTLTGLLMLLGGALATAVGFAVPPIPAAHSALTALAWATSTSLGALFFLMVGLMSRASWFVPVRRVCEGWVAALPLLALLFIPVLLSMAHLYPWAPGHEGLTGHAAELVDKKRAYLNVPFFVGRAVGFWVFFLALAGTLLAWSRALDRGDTTRHMARLRALSAGGFIALGLVGSFAMHDWLMSLAPAWYSNMFPAYVLIGGFVSGAGLTAFGAVRAMRAGVLQPFTDEHRQALGTLVFATVCAWMWFTFSQFYIIWIADIPEGIAWYRDRVHGGWLWLGIALVIARFALPFALLLVRAIKRHPTTLAAIGLWLSAAHFVHMHWIVLPQIHDALRPSWLDVSALLAAAGALWLGPALWLRVVPILPERDPRYHAALEYVGTRP
jgi:hypothetical protein